MRLKTLDHVALWVADRDTITDFLTERLSMHVIERTDKFTLVGTDARRGKLTLFAEEGPREQGALKHVARRVEVGGAFVEFHDGEPGEPERPLLNHLAVLVDSAEATLDEAKEAGMDVADVVDAPNTYAIFVWGPEGVKIEYVEQKPTFALK